MGKSATTEALRFRSSDGAVVGVPRRWLRLEGLTLLFGSLVAYSTTRQPLWLVPLTLLLPDLLMVGYLAGTRFGASMYNVAHTTSLPAALIGLGWWQHQLLAVALGLVWLAHIGMDRLMGYGLKYGDDAQHTHLGLPGNHKAPVGPHLSSVSVPVSDGVDRRHRPTVARP
jgi:hypothetical protein